MIEGIAFYIDEFIIDDDPYISVFSVGNLNNSIQYSCMFKYMLTIIVSTDSLSQKTYKTMPYSFFLSQLECKLYQKVDTHRSRAAILDFCQIQL